MTNPFHFEALTPGMKAKLDVKYRRSQQEAQNQQGQNPENNKFRKSFSQSKRKTTFPLINKSKSYFTFG